MKRRVFLKSISATAGALAFPAVAVGQQYKAEYKMSTVVPPAFAWGKGGEIFCNLVRERTGGRINVKQYPGSSLVQGDQTREFSAMRQGVIDVLCGAPINWYSTVRELAVFTLPFITPDHKALDAVLANQTIMNEYFDLVRKAGAEPVGVGETGYRQISNSKRPVLKPDDLRSNAEDFAGLVADIDHRHFGLVAQPREIGQDFEFARAVKRGERLVKQQQARRHQQRATDRDALALAARKLSGPPRQ